MSEFRNQLNAFKEQQTELNQNFLERLNSLEEQNKNTNEPLSALVQIGTILEKLATFDDRLKKLEFQSPINNQVK